MDDRLYMYHQRRRPTDMVAGDRLPAIQPLRAAAEGPCRRWNLFRCLALCVVTLLLLLVLIPPISAAADELPKPDTAYCIGDKENPGKFGCAEAGWSPGAIHRNLGVRQRVEGSEADVIMAIVRTERYYDEEVPLMPKDVQENW